MHRASPRRTEARALSVFAACLAFAGCGAPARTRPERGGIIPSAQDSADAESGYRLIEIADGTLRDLTFVAANIRPEDWREIAAQLPEGTTPTQAGAICYAAGRSWVATWKGQPIAAFGVSPIAASVLSIWAWGTPQMWRSVPAITRYVDNDLAPEWERLGITRIEARSIADHEQAHRWLRRLGFEETPCPEFGRGGEDYVLFYFTRKMRKARPSVMRRSHAVE